MNANPRELAVDATLGELEPVAYFDGAMLTGVTVSRGGRIFVNFPKWGDDVQFTVAEVKDNEVVPYPDRATNKTKPKIQRRRSSPFRASLWTPLTGFGSWTPEARCSN